MKWLIRVESRCRDTLTLEMSRQAERHGWTRTPDAAVATWMKEGRALTITQELEGISITADDDDRGVASIVLDLERRTGRIERARI